MEEAVLSVQSARLKRDLLRKVIEAAIEGTKAQLVALKAQRTAAEQLHRKGYTSVDKVLEVTHREAQVTMTLQILQLILQADGTETEQPEAAESNR